MNYFLLCKQLSALLEGVDSTVSKLANAAALLFYSVEDINWAGFYLAEDNRLELGPFQGKPACTLIPFGKGVCGTAVSERRTVAVDNVHAFPGHIACDSASNAEIVIPLYKNGSIFGVLDIDSESPGRFAEADKEGLEAFAAIIEAHL